MKIVVVVFGRGIDLDVSVSGGIFSLTLGHHLDMLLGDDGTRGRRWFDWESGSTPGSFAFWLGRRHGTVDLGPALAWLAPKPGTERVIPAAA